MQIPIKQLRKLNLFYCYKGTQADKDRKTVVGRRDAGTERQTCERQRLTQISCNKENASRRDNEGQRGHFHFLSANYQC